MTIEFTRDVGPPMDHGWRTSTAPRHPDSSSGCTHCTAGGSGFEHMFHRSPEDLQVTWTPAWRQRPPTQTAAPNTGAVNQVGEPDRVQELGAAPPHPPPHHQPQQHHPPPHHALQLAEAYWPETAQLVHPARGGKLLLLAPNISIQAVVQDAIPIMFRHVASIDSFPSGEDKVKVIRDSLYKAAENEGFNEITDRLSQDRNCGRWLSSLVRTLTQPFPPYPSLSSPAG